VSDRENKFNEGPVGNTNYGRLAFQNFVRDVDMAHDNVQTGYVLTAQPEGEVAWMPGGGGGGGTGSGTIVFQPGGASFNNVFATWAEIISALALSEGQTTVQIDTQYGAAVIPGGAYNLSGVTLLGSDCGPRVTLSIADGVTFTGDFPILKGLTLISNSTAPIRTVSGTETLYVCLYDSSMETTDAEIINVSISTAAVNVLLSDGSEWIDNAGPVLDLTGATATIKMGDRATLNVGTISDNGSGTISIDTRSETATPHRQLAAEFTGTWTAPVAHYNRTIEYQAAHGYTVDQVLSHDATVWILADANVADKQPTAIVTEVLDANTFALRTEGRVWSPAHGFTVGETYYLSASTPGAVQTNPTGYAQRVLRVTSADEYVIQFSEADRPDYIYDRQAGGGAGIKYFGFERIDDSRWLVKLQVTVAGVVTETYANEGNNGAYATLAAAWPNRATLTYTTYALLTNL